MPGEEEIPCWAFLTSQRSWNDDNSTQLIDNPSQLNDNFVELIDNAFELIDNLPQLNDNFFLASLCEAVSN